MNTIASGLSFLSTKMTEGMSYLSKSTTHFTERKAVIVSVIAAAATAALSTNPYTTDLSSIGKTSTALLATVACSSVYFTAAGKINRFFKEEITKPQFVSLIPPLCPEPDFTVPDHDTSYPEFLQNCLYLSSDKSVCIKNIKMMSEEDRKRLALFCANIDAEHTVKNFKNFGMICEEDIKEVAFLCANIDAEHTVKNFKNFGMTCEEDIKEVALLCAKTCTWGTTEFFENFGLTRQEDIKEVALLCAKTVPINTTYSFKNLGLTRQEDIKEVALLCAKTNLLSIPEFFKNLGLTREEDIKEIALLCAKTEALSTAIRFKNFGLARQEDIKEIALLYAKTDAPLTTQYFKNFGLIRQEDIKEIALLCAKTCAWGTSANFKNFGLTRQEDIKEIALLCAKTHPSNTADHFKNFGLTREEDIKEIAPLCFLQNPEYVNFFLDNFSIKDQVFIRRLRLLAKTADCSALSPEICNNLHLKMDQDPAALGYPADSEVTSYLQQEKNRLSSLDLHFPPAIRYYQHLCMAELLRSSVGKEGFRPFIESALISIFNLRDQTLIPRLFLTLCKANDCSFPLVDEQKTDTLYKSFITLSTEGPDLRKHTVVTTLASIEGLSQLKEEVRSPFIKGMKDILPKLRLTLKDGRKKLDVQYARTLFKLQETPLSQEQIFTLIETQDRITTSQEFAFTFTKKLQHLNVLALTGFFDMGLPEGLTDIESAYSTCVQHAFFGEEVLSEVNQAEFEKNRSKLQIPRHPAALELYALNLKKLNNEALNTEMQRFVWNLLRGSFHQARYSGSSEHMDILRKDFPALWEQWQTLPKSIPLEPDAAALSVNLCYAEENSTWLTQTLGEGHGGDTLRTIVNRMRQKETLTSPIEKLCAALCQQPISLDQTKEVLNKLQHAAGADSKLKQCQWLQDIRDRLTLLSPKQQEGHLEVMISDTWEDLFLSGTDVLGSCQRIDGDPHLNQCLLGYCMDGKIQMAAIKEQETGKIVSRAILKLLLNPNKEGHLAPALFLERIYPNPCSPSYTAALEQIARERAQALGVPLYTKAEEGAATEAVTLCSLGSPSPFEYEDGGAGIADGGKYEIKGKVFL